MLKGRRIIDKKEEGEEKIKEIVSESSAQILTPFPPLPSPPLLSLPVNSSQLT
jgi:hypothetical protein